MSDVIFNPSLLNWSSLILTVAHFKIVPLPLTSSNQSGWMINCLGWKRLKFRWQHPESKGKLDAVTLSHGFPKGHLRRPIVLKCSNIILQTSHQSCHFPCSFRPRRSLHQHLKLLPRRSRRLEMSQFVWEVRAFAPKIDFQNLSFE